jgi:hypothetical protein
MSTDQQWAGGGGGGMGARGMQHEQMHERRIPVHDRFVPFLAPYLMTLFVIPTVELISWGLCLIWPGYMGMVVICWCFLGFTLAAGACAYGAWVTKRVPFVYKLVAVALIAWGLASAMTTAYGLWTLPPWLVIHLFGSLGFATIFALMRIDSLRTAAANGNGRDVWGEVIGLRTSRPQRITQTPTGVEIEVAHGPGETAEDVRSAAKKLESAANAVSGRTTVTPSESGRAGSSTIRMSFVDVFKDWREWPGPSHPGGSFAYPLRTGYYETGEPEWFSFATSLKSPLTSFRSEMDTFLGAAGATGSGKSGGINNAVAEGLTRCDVIPVWLDRAKIEQNAGWCLDMLGMAAGNANAQHIVQAVRKLADYRVKVFGQVALNEAMDPDADPDAETGRKWTPELAEQTGEAAILFIVDEADTAIQGKGWEWLSARGRSLGIFLYGATPRASAAEVPALVRGSIAAWKTYAIGDNYSDGFTISNETADAGADPKRLRAPGLHYLDRAPGLDLRQCATLAREYRSSPGRLRRDVLKYRGVTFEPMGFSQGAIEAMGEDYRQCLPERLMPGWTPPPENDPLPENVSDNEIRALCLALVSGAIAGTTEEIEQARRILAANVEPAATTGTNMSPADQTGSADDDEEEEDDDMSPTAEGVDEMAGDVRPIAPDALYDNDEMRLFRQVDLDEPIMARGREVTFNHTKPVWSDEQTDAELDRVIVTFKRARKLRFGNQDVMEAMRCYFAPATCSRRLNALSNGKRTVPGGLSIERHGPGDFEILGELDPSYNPPRHSDNEEN